MVILSMSVGTSAQKMVTKQGLFWLRYYNQVSINRHWVWHNEVEDRRFFEHNRQHHFILHSRIHRKIVPGIEVGLGITYSLQSPQDPNATSYVVVPEIRPNQELNTMISVSKRFTIQNRWRIDERFVHRNNGKELKDGYDFNFRFRYRFQTNFKVGKLESNYPLIVKISNEIMINAGKNIVYNHFDQNRFCVGLEKTFARGISLEIAYIRWFQQRAIGNQFYERDIIRTTFYHKI